MDYWKFLSFFVLVFNSVTYSSCWQYFTSLNDLIVENSEPSPQYTHSEYFFGDCRRKEKRYYAHIYLDHMAVLGKVIVRGWIDIERIPTCIRLRALANVEDTFRSTSFRFQICVPRITYCHSQKRYKYFYYEWYIPEDLIGGMNWEMYFFGANKLEWG